MNTALTAAMTQLFDGPWAMAEQRLQALMWMAQQRIEGRAIGPGFLASQLGISAESVARAKSSSTRAGAVAIVPVVGVFTQRGDMFDEFFGGGSVSTMRLSATLAEIAADPGIGTVVLDIDSPGGSVYGVAEVSAQLAALRGQKRTIAVSNSLAASAAYWFASSADEVVVTPSGETGSIGVYMMHADYSALYENAGVKMTTIAAGKYKAEASPFQPLSAEARAHLQESVDAYYQAFVKAVANNRKASQTAVREGYGQGRVLGAEASVKAGLADRIATLDQVVGELISAQPKPRRASSLAASERELKILG